MARRKSAIKRHEVVPDPVYNSRDVGRFINFLMWEGKRSVAARIMYKAMDMACAKLSVDDPVGLFGDILEKVAPSVEVKRKRVGGSAFQVPIEVPKERSVTLAMRWLVGAARQRSEKGMVMRLSNEFLDVLQGRGGAIKKREDMEKMAAANQAFAHFRW